MARARNIKPAFFSNEILAELPPLARLLFIGLWCLADRKGRLQDRPKRIKHELLGYDDVTSAEVDQMLQQLHENGFIIRYQVDGQRYIQVTNFLKHQNPHCREQESTIPAPGEHATEPGAIAGMQTDKASKAGNGSDEDLTVGERAPEKWREASGGAAEMRGEFLETAADNAKKRKESTSTVHEQCGHGAGTVEAGLIPDSLNLIPDSKTSSSVERPAGKEEGKDFSPDWKNAKRPIETSFCKFWDAYPKHVGKLACWKAWQRLRPSDELLDRMIETLDKWKKSRSWTKDGGKFIPHPATWLNRGGWEDECTEDGRSFERDATNRFNNFHQRDYDFDQLERQLLNS